MSKMIRRIVFGGIGVVVLLVAVLFFLVQGTVRSSDQLKNIQPKTTIQELVQSNLTNPSLTEDGVLVKMSLDNNQFVSVVKGVITEGDTEVQDTSIQLKQDYLRIQKPVKLAFIDSKLDIQFSTLVKNDELVLRIANAKLGNLPIAKSFVASQMKETLAKNNSSAAKVEGNDLIIAIPTSSFKFKDAQIKDGKLTVEVAVAIAEVLNSFASNTAASTY